MIDKNNIAYWFPRLKRSGVNVPRTKIINTNLNLAKLLDMETPEGFSLFIDHIQEAINEIGYPAFLRTGHYSGKHSWDETCFISDESENLRQHIYQLIEESEIVEIFGLPYQTWAIREFLQLQYFFTAFGGLPIARERRYFIRDYEVVCHHPYWPAGAIRAPSTDKWRTQLEIINEETPLEIEMLTREAKKVAKVFDGYWSVDFAFTVDGVWYAIDMAEGNLSWHWPGCPNGGAS
jgi:hypothetical protein